MPTYAPADLAFERGDGPYLFTAAQEKYLDFASGIGVNALGHSHPHLVKALTDQAARLWHTANLFRIAGQERLARRLTECTFADTVFFANSGAEAIECAIKVARKYHAHNGAPERYRIITFNGAFHGRTLAAIAAAGQEKHLEGFGPPVQGFDHVEIGDLDGVRGALSDETAAILIEPVQGESGIKPVAVEFMKALRQIADDNGILLIHDEVQCGMGRTGRLFAHEWSGITPDIMTAAKGIGGGFPMGACLATERAAQGMVFGTHGSTFGGNPLAMAVGNAVLDIVLEDGFLEHVRHISGFIQQQLGSLRERYPDVVEEVRGTGLMLGLKCRVPNIDLVVKLREYGLVAARAGDNVVRFLPPLIIDENHVREAVAAIEKACADLTEATAET
ncbi:MAG: aspartate aminotransferase family protein [Sphingomonadales bacterium]